MLERDDERTVIHRNSPSGALEGEIPGFPLDLARQVHRLRPGQAVVRGADHHQLGCRRRGETAAGRPPGRLAGLAAMRPGREDEDVARHFVHEDTGVSDSIDLLRQAAPFAHVHGDDHRPPGPSAVGGTAHAHVDIPLQVAGILVADVIDAHQRSLLRGDQTGDPVGIHPVIAGGADLPGEPVPQGAAFLYIKTSCLDSQREWFPDVFYLGGIQIDIQIPVPDRPGTEGLSGQSFQGNLEIRRFPFGDGHGRDGNVLVLDDRDLVMVDLDGRGGDEREKS